MTTVDEWIDRQDPKYHDAARTFVHRILTTAPTLRTHVHSNGILGFGLGNDDYYLLAFAVRKDGLRFYSDTKTNAQLKDALGKKLVGKSCIRLKTALDLDDELLGAIIAGSLASAAADQ